MLKNVEQTISTFRQQNNVKRKKNKRIIFFPSILCIFLISKTLFLPFFLSFFVTGKMTAKGLNFFLYRKVQTIRDIWLEDRADYLITR